jgi:hypothetical protein
MQNYSCILNHEGRVGRGRRLLSAGTVDAEAEDEPPSFLLGKLLTVKSRTVSPTYSSRRNFRCGGAEAQRKNKGKNRERDDKARGA